MATMLQLYHDSMETRFHPEIYAAFTLKYGKDYGKFTRMIFSKSIFTDEKRMTRFLSSFSRRTAKKIRKDPAYAVISSFIDMMKSKASDEMNRFNTRMASLQKRYMKAQMEMNDSNRMYPDANLTMRVAYGQVKSYSPNDAVHYDFQSTLQGLMEKYIPGDPDFDVPEKLRSLYAAKDYGPYAANGEVPVAFIATNHTTGGNSGSPVINANGELIGTNFDRVWEGTLSDIQYDGSLCRNIALDIRYTLFIIEKLGGAENIIAELSIVK
jgi:hypothetical protein